MKNNPGSFFVFDLHQASLGYFESENDLLQFSQGQNPDSAKRWAVSLDRHAWVSLADWVRYKNTQSNFTPDTFMLERRLDSRFEMRFQVNLVSRCRSFASYTIDVSEGGLLLERNIPPSIQREVCDVQIISPSNREMIQIKGRLDDSNESRRVHFLANKNGELIPALLKWVTVKSQSGRRAA